MQMTIVKRIIKYSNHYALIDLSVSPWQSVCLEQSEKCEGSENTLIIFFSFSFKHRYNLQVVFLALCFPSDYVQRVQLHCLCSFSLTVLFSI